MTPPLCFNKQYVRLTKLDEVMEEYKKCKGCPGFPQDLCNMFVPYEKFKYIIDELEARR